VRLLLDTHVVLGLVEPKKEQPPAWIIEAARRPEHELFVSVVSIWEVAIKHRLGKLPLPCPLREWPELLEIAGVTIIGLDFASVLIELDPVPETKDPFDRLLLGVAGRQGMRLLTMDRALVAHPLAWRPA
jgi:PIN domain nuclease of toxin-antitoxin system